MPDNEKMPGTESSTPSDPSSNPNSEETAQPSTPGSAKQRASSAKSAVDKIAKQPERFEEMSRSMMMMMGSGPFPNPLHEKMTEAHIGKILEISANHDEREFSLASRQQDHHDSNRWFMIAVLVIVLLAVGFFCFLFKDKPDILQPILTGILGFGAGALGGYGVGKSKGD